MEGNLETIFEIWMPIKDFEGHEVSNCGRVRNIARTIIRIKNGKSSEVALRGKVLATSFDLHGYERVCLWKDNRQYGRIVHRLVVEAFWRPIALGEQVNHIDFNRANNRLANLEILPRVANTLYSTDAGRRAKKLSEEQVLQIKCAMAWGEDKRLLAAQYGITSTNINHIIAGRTWERVKLSDLARHD